MGCFELPGIGSLARALHHASPMPGVGEREEPNSSLAFSPFIVQESFFGSPTIVAILAFLGFHRSCTETLGVLFLGSSKV